MLSKSKKDKLSNAIKAYCKKYLHGRITELDESGTRIMINSFLTDVLGFIQIEEVKTEYMIRGTYADYVVQTNGTRHFLVEVKAYKTKFSDEEVEGSLGMVISQAIKQEDVIRPRRKSVIKKQPPNVIAEIASSVSNSEAMEGVETVQ